MNDEMKLDAYYSGSIPSRGRCHGYDEKVLPVDGEGICWYTQGLPRRERSVLPMGTGPHAHYGTTRSIIATEEEGSKILRVPKILHIRTLEGE